MPDKKVASVTYKASNFTSLMVVVDAKAPITPAPLAMSPTNSADAALFLKQFLIQSDAEVSIFAASRRRPALMVARFATPIKTIMRGSVFIKVLSWFKGFAARAEFVSFGAFSIIVPSGHLGLLH